MIDLTDIESPKFEYQGKNQDGTVFTVSLDFDWLGMELQSRIPTAFQPAEVDSGTGELTGPAPMMGLQVILKSFMEGKSLPESLPSFNHVIDAIEKVFRVPGHCGVMFKLSVLTAWMAEMNRRNTLKKNIPDSPASSGDTPEASESTNSPPASAPPLSMVS